jgi:hypothetical protein
LFIFVFKVASVEIRKVDKLFEVLLIFVFKILELSLIIELRLILSIYKLSQFKLPLISNL